MISDNSYLMLFERRSALKKYIGSVGRDKVVVLHEQCVFGADHRQLLGWREHNSGYTTIKAIPYIQGHPIILARYMLYILFRIYLDLDFVGRRRGWLKIVLERCQQTFPLFRQLCTVIYQGQLQRLQCYGSIQKTFVNFVRRTVTGINRREKRVSLDVTVDLEHKSIV